MNNTSEIEIQNPGSDIDVEEGLLFMPKFDSSGLVTAVTVDAKTNEIIMVAHMDREALINTIRTNEVWYWSRSRNKLWRKGDTSGQIQRVKEIRVDCDQDALILFVDIGGDGGCCHTGRKKCFYRRIDGIDDNNRVTLTAI